MLISIQTQALNKLTNKPMEKLIYIFCYEQVFQIDKFYRKYNISSKRLKTHTESSKGSNNKKKQLKYNRVK